jgi:hypothetical protein
MLCNIVTVLAVDFPAMSLPVPGCCFAQSSWRTLRTRKLLLQNKQRPPLSSVQIVYFNYWETLLGKKLSTAFFSGSLIQEPVRMKTVLFFNYNCA